MSFERTIDKSGILKKEGASVGKCLLSRRPGPVFHPQHYETSNQSKDIYSKGRQEISSNRKVCSLRMSTPALSLSLLQGSSGCQIVLWLDFLPAEVTVDAGSGH